MIHHILAVCHTLFLFSVVCTRGSEYPLKIPQVYSHLPVPDGPAADELLDGGLTRPEQRDVHGSGSDALRPERRADRRVRVEPQPQVRVCKVRYACESEQRVCEFWACVRQVCVQGVEKFSRVKETRSKRHNL